MLHERPDQKRAGGDQHQEQDDGERDGPSGESAAAVRGFPGSEVLDADVVIICEKGMKRFVTRS